MNVFTNDMKQQCVAKPQEKRHEWAWMPAPIKTQWGHDMVVADLAIDKDHTVSVYCERDQAEKVEAMLSAQPQREWVGLTPTDIADALGPCPKYFSEWTDADVIYFARTLDAKLKDKNT